MARLPKKVDSFIHLGTGVSVDIRLDTKQLQFMAVLPDGSEMRDMDGDNLKHRISEWLGLNMKLEWEAAILVKSIPPQYSYLESDSVFIGIDVERLYIAKQTSGNKVMALDWDKYGSGATGRYITNHYGQRLVLPWKSGTRYGGAEYYLPYSEDLWSGLQEILADLRRQKANLDNVLTSDLAAIESAGCMVLLDIDIRSEHDSLRR